MDAKDRQSAGAAFQKGAQHRTTHGAGGELHLHLHPAHLAANWRTDRTSASTTTSKSSSSSSAAASSQETEGEVGGDGDLPSSLFRHTAAEWAFRDAYSVLATAELFMNAIIGLFTVLEGHENRRCSAARTRSIFFLLLRAARFTSAAPRSITSKHGYNKLLSRQTRVVRRARFGLPSMPVSACAHGHEVGDPKNSPHQAMMEDRSEFLTAEPTPRVDPRKVCVS